MVNQQSAERLILQAHEHIHHPSVPLETLVCERDAISRLIEPLTYASRSVRGASKRMKLTTLLGLARECICAADHRLENTYV